jgi:ABC-type phosphate transport system substrate-binding protein
VGRADGSGTRNAFENRVLGGNTEPSPTSDANDCATRDRTYKNTDITRCEQNSTDRLLKTVAQTPGAIGYAELNYAQAYAKRGQLRLLGLDGESPSLKAVRERAYPFWAPEYAYTYGVPPNNSLMSRFLDYMAGDTGRNVMESHGHLPCSVPENQSACQQARGDEW